MFESPSANTNNVEVLVNRKTPFVGKLISEDGLLSKDMGWTTRQTL